MRFLKRALAVMGLSIVVTGAVASTTSPVSNVDYQTLEKAVPTDAGSKIEVIEFFSYSCPFCKAFDPQLAAWVKAKGDGIVFKRVPLQIHEGDVLLQKLYFALDDMGITEQLHSKIFRAVQDEHKQYGDANQVADIVAGFGVDRTKFLGAFDSFGMPAKLQRANQLARSYQVSDVPQLEIDGRYKASIGITEAALGRKSQPELASATLSVSDWLIAKAAKEHKPQAASGVAKK
jgi:thiol:disulfide interchange protein DsbA